MEFKLIIVLLLQTCLCMVTSRKMAVNNSLSRESKVHKSHVIRTIKSEDGDIIDCVDIYKQPAFDHPALKDHKIQLSPSRHAKSETLDEDEESYAQTVTTQTWQKSGSCPKGTIPIRRTKGNNVVYRKPTFLNYNESKPANVLQMNHSAILIANGFAYFGAKADIIVWNPRVEKDDEYSTSQIALKNGALKDYEAVEAGWMVNPRVYGDRKTRLFAYWTVDANMKTGCFDLTCPGFVQTSNEIALGAAIYPISTPYGLPYQINIFIHQDQYTRNWWLTYGETKNIGYWPVKLFSLLRYQAMMVEWGGEVYSTRVGPNHPHTRTGMGSGEFPFMQPHDGRMFRMRVLENGDVLRFPQFVRTYMDEPYCYQAYFSTDYFMEPEFYYGGPGAWRNPNC